MPTKQHQMKLALSPDDHAIVRKAMKRAKIKSDSQLLRMLLAEWTGEPELAEPQRGRPKKEG